MTVYIIGIDHLVQYNGPLAGEIIDEFSEFLAAKISELEISLVAEEFNEEYLHDVFGASEDTAKAAAERTGIEHMYCDPDEGEREMLGIPYYADVRDVVKERRGISDRIIFDNDLRRSIERETSEEVKRHWKVRENFWYERIKDRVPENILFLCGHEHVAGFSSMLKEKGIDVSVIDEFWQRSLFSDYGRLGLR